MIRRWRSIATFVLVTIVSYSTDPVLGQSFHTQASYSFVTVDIPTPDGQFGFTTLEDINAKGEIAGAFTNSIVGPFGYILDKKFRPTEIRCSEDVLSTEPQSINNQGEITGFASVITQRIPIPFPPFEILITKISGFFFDKKGGCTILDFPGATLTEATGVNERGQVVGDYRDAAGRFHGFIWDDGQFVTFDVPFPNASGTALTAINNGGQIVGFYSDTAGQAHPFLYDNGVLTPLEFPNAQFTSVSDINERGQIAGTYTLDAVNGPSHGFVLEDGNFATIDVPFPGVRFTDVRGINDRGQIVGRYLVSNPGDPVNPFVNHGFIATPTGSAKLVALSAEGTNEPPGQVTNDEIRRVSIGSVKNRWLASSLLGDGL